MVGLIRGYEPGTNEQEMIVTCYEPYHQDRKGKPIMPLWLYAQTSDTAVDTSWERACKLPWLQIEAMPMTVARDLHRRAGNTNEFYPPPRMHKKKYFGKDVEVQQMYANKGYQTVQSRDRVVCVVSIPPAQRKFGGVVRFNAQTLYDLRELEMMVD